MRVICGQASKTFYHLYIVHLLRDDPSKSYVGGGGVTNFTSSGKIKLSIPLAALLFKEPATTTTGTALATRTTQ